MRCENIAEKTKNTDDIQKNSIFQISTHFCPNSDPKSPKTKKSQKSRKIKVENRNVIDIAHMYEVLTYF